jgi:hypothetical protein
MIQVQWYQLAYGEVPTFSTTGRFITFAEHLHITLWAGGTGLNPVIQEFNATDGQKLEQVVQQYLESAARRVAHIFHGTLHAVIYSISSETKRPVRVEYTTMALGLAYAQMPVIAKFQYMSVSGLKIKLPTEVDPEQGRKIVSRYNRPPVI